MKIAVVGATGLVGQSFLNLLETEFNTPVKSLKLFSKKPKTCFFLGKKIQSQKLKYHQFKDIDLCFFSAGEKVSRTWAPRAVKEGAIVIDNSSAFRQDSDKLLIVPEINGQLLKYKPQIISNPNCSTIQLVVALQALHESFGLQSVQVVSLQSISGAGKQALEELKKDSQDILSGKKKYEQKPIGFAFNCVPYIGEINKSGFCTEEEKIMKESQKILGLARLNISAFTVRVPSLNGHSEVVHFSLKKEAQNTKELTSALSKYVKVTNSPPHPRMASGKKEIFVGRIHKDRFRKKTWFMWIVADNLLKGASLNGIQIAKKLSDIKRKGI